MEETSIAIRAAEPEEAGALTELAMRSKAHHGYDEAFLARVRPMLTLTAASIEENPVFVIEERGRIGGFYALRALGEGEVELDFLFIEPQQIGRGFGRALWNHAVAEARALGYRTMRIESDPFAEPFYAALGAERVGEVASDAAPGRVLPVLRYAL